MRYSLPASPVKADVVIVTDAHMPAGDATANRMHAIALALAHTGLSVAVVGRGDEDSLPSGVIKDNISYHLWYVGRAPRERLLCAIEHYWGGLIFPLVRTLVGEGARVILCNHGGSPFLLRLFAMGRRLKVPVVIDVTEWWWWLRQRGLKVVPLPLVIEHVVRNRFLYPRSRRVIAVSQALSRFYRTRGCSVFRLPPLLDLNERCWQVERQPPQDGALHILFSGSPDRERWDVILEGVLEANRCGTPVVLELLGVAPQRFLRILGPQRHLAERCGTRLVFHGRLSAECVLPTIAGAHFGILIRDDAPWSRGCFPSKVAEFLALGVPVMFTPNGDLDEYLQEGLDSVRIAVPTSACLVDGLARAWALVQQGRWEGMSRAAAERARERFDCRLFGSPLRRFLGV